MNFISSHKRLPGIVHNSPCFCACICVMFMTACASEYTQPTTGQGYISPSVVFNDNMTLVGENKSIKLNAEYIPTEAQLSFTLSSANGQYSHTWDSFSDFSDKESFLSGEYMLVFNTQVSKIYNETECLAEFGGRSMVSILDGETVNAPVVVSPKVGLIRSYIDNNSNSSVSLISIVSCSQGGEFQQINENKEFLVNPGKISFLANLKNSKGEIKTILTDATATLNAAEALDASLSYNNNILNISLGKNNFSTEINESVFSESSPLIQCIGFSPEDNIEATEGIPLEHEIMVDVVSERPLKKLILSLSSPLYGEKYLQEYNLLENSTGLSNLIDMGLGIYKDNNGKSFKIDFTSLIENASVKIKTDSHVSLLAINDIGICSDIVKFSTTTSGVDFKLSSVANAIIGENKASITLATSSPYIEQSDFKIFAITGGITTECKILNMQILPDERYVTIDFLVPEGVLPVDINVMYLGNKRLDATVNRESPSFTMSFDSYATKAYITINADTPQLIDAIIKLATFKANGQRVSILERCPQDSFLLISGLKPETEYQISASFGDGGDIASGIITTELAEQVPSGDFEDAKEVINHKHMPSGGRYSATDIPIINRQNFKDITVMWPKKHWASVNAKTFSSLAATKNTWYMVPSSEISFDAVSGSKSIMISSVGWDLNGQPIPDYVQTPGESLDYNANIPYVRHRAAGKLFLGSYAFDPNTLNETYNEGVGFYSRPSSLNGFYKYITDIENSNDYGTVTINLIGKDDSGNEILIASGSGNFRFASDFTSFNVPLKYIHLHKKPTRLTIMFSSSGTNESIIDEDLNVPVTPTPIKGIMQGSTLWIDNLTFSY